MSFTVIWITMGTMMPLSTHHARKAGVVDGSEKNAGKYHTEFLSLTWLSPSFPLTLIHR